MSGGQKLMKKKMMTLLLACILILAGCTPKDMGDLDSMGMIADIGGVKDHSFNQSAWEGLQKAGAEFQMDVSYVETKDESEYEENIQTLLDSDRSLIWGIGFKMEEEIKKAAQQNPNQKFAIIDHDCGENNLENLLGIVFKAEESSYLMGIIAAKMTKTGKVGFIGGMDAPIIHQFLFGFMQGVHTTDPDTEVVFDYVGAFNTPDKGYEMAKKMYDEGVDLIFQAAGDTGNGVIQAAKECDKMVIGVDKDQNELAPDHVISSAVKRLNLVIYQVAQELKEGKFEGGKTRYFGLNEEGVGISMSTAKHVPRNVLQLVEESKKKIISGEIIVCATEEDYNNRMQ